MIELKLTEEEAQFLRTLLGYHIGGTGRHRKTLNDVLLKLDEVAKPFPSHLPVSGSTARFGYLCLSDEHEKVKL